MVLLFISLQLNLGSLNSGQLKAVVTGESLLLSIIFVQSFILLQVGEDKDLGEKEVSCTHQSQKQKLVAFISVSYFKQFSLKCIISIWLPVPALQLLLKKTVGICLCINLQGGFFIIVEGAN